MDAAQIELHQRIACELESLGEALQAGRSDRFERLLTFWGNFHNYSFHNTLLIMMQRPEAQRVASYRAWKKAGRQVRKGAKAIWIFAPTFKKHETEEGEIKEFLAGFVRVPVFADRDLEDIDTNPLPSVFEHLADDVPELLDYLKDQCQSAGIPVVEQTHPDGALGTSDGKRLTIEATLPSRNKVAVLVHELAHHQSHWGTDRPELSKRVKELEAEAVSHVICALLGIENPSSADYCLLYQADAELFRQTLSRVQATIKKVMQVLDLENVPQALAA